MAPVTRAAARKAQTDLNKQIPSDLAYMPKVSKTARTSAREHHATHPSGQQASRSHASSFASFKISRHLSLPSSSPTPFCTIHVDPAALSPGSRPSKHEELRLILTEDCPGCVSASSQARSRAVENLAQYERPFDNAACYLPRIEETLRHQNTMMLMLLGDQCYGAEGPQMLDELRAAMDRTERDRLTCLEDMAAVDGMQRKLRREWGKTCEGLFGEAVAKAPQKPKGRISLRIRPDRRLFTYHGRLLIGAQRYLETSLLELP